MRTRTRWIAGFAATAILLSAVVSVSAYTGQVPSTAVLSVADSVECRDTFPVSSTFLDVDGAPVEGLSVTWSLVTAQSTDDTIHDTVTTTDEDGVATTTVTLAAVPGDRRIGVTSGDVTASAVVSQSCAGLSLPRTSTIEPASAGVGAGLFALLVSLVLGAGIAVTLLRRTHRGEAGPG
jgi:hypothetical protein